jgi:branched-chain amino acid transport system ATP-binding protein
VSLLEVDDLRTGYGVQPVLQGVSFKLDEGRTGVIFGLNGAGKTTTLNAIAGLVPTWSGEVRLDGSRITGLAPSAVVRRGIALCPEGRRVFPGLPVRTNLELGAWTKRAGMKVALDRVYGYFPRLEERSKQYAGTLSGGEQQMLAIGRALMGQPRLLLIDEASLGLSPRLAQSVFEIVKTINADGTTVLMVEQNIGVLPYADQALVMEKGTLTFDGAAAKLVRTGELRKAYLG